MRILEVDDDCICIQAEKESLLGSLHTYFQWKKVLIFQFIRPS